MDISLRTVVVCAGAIVRESEREQRKKTAVVWNRRWRLHVPRGDCLFNTPTSLRTSWNSLLASSFTASFMSAAALMPAALGIAAAAEWALFPPNRKTHSTLQNRATENGDEGRVGSSLFSSSRVRTAPRSDTECSLVVSHQCSNIVTSLRPLLRSATKGG